MLSCRQIWPWLEFTVGDEAGDFGARAGAAGGAVVCAAGTEDEVAGVGDGGGAEQFDVVDRLVMGASDVGAFEGATDTPSEIGQSGDIGKFELLAVIFGEEEPVAAPGDVAGDGAVAFDVDFDIRGVAVAGDVLDGDLVGVVEGGGDDADGGFDAVLTW